MPTILSDTHTSLLRAVALKYVFFDVDGTLKNSQHVISDVTVAAVRRLSKQKIGYGLASGRPYFGAKPVIEALHVTGPSVFFSGALVIEPGSGKVLHEEALRPEEVHFILDFAHRENIFAEIYTADDYFCETESELGALHAMYLDKAPIVAPLAPIIASKPILKVEFVATTPREHEIIRKFAAETTQVHSGLGYGASHPNVLFANVTSTRASREHALEKVLRHLGLTRKNIAAFGDAEADMPFLKLAELGFAMGNAPLHVQQVARFVTKSVDDDGVAYALGLLQPEAALVEP